MLDQAALGHIAQEAIEGRVAIIYHDDIDQAWWLKSKDGEIDEIVTDDEMVTIINSGAERLHEAH